MSAAPALPLRPSARPSPRPASPRRARPQLRVVGPPRHVRRYAAAMVVSVAVGIFGTVSLNALAAEQSFAVRNLEAEVTDLSLRYEELTAEVAQLESPERIRSVAVVQLGMVPADQPGYLMAERRVAGDGESRGSDGIVRTSSPIGGGDVADPVKPVLGAGR